MDWKKQLKGAQDRMVQQIDKDGNKVQLIRTGLQSLPILYARKRNVAVTVLAAGIYCLMIKDPHVHKQLTEFRKLAPSIDIYGTFSTEILESEPEGFPSEDEPKKSNILQMP